MNTASRKIVIGFFFLQLTVMQGFAQWYNPDKVNKKAQQLNEEAYEVAQEGNYTGAITLLDKALQADPKFLDAILSKAGIYGNLKNYDLSVKEYENALEVLNTMDYAMDLKKALIYIKLKDYERANLLLKKICIKITKIYTSNSILKSL